MASIIPCAKKILQWEGTKYTNDPLDAGGPTKMGITLKTWQRYGHDMDFDGDIDADDVQKLGLDEFTLILKVGYWDMCKADYIKSQSVAEILVDWYYMSGVTAAKRTQRILGVNPDGEIGSKTVEAINATDPATLFHQIQQERLQHIKDIIILKPSQKRFEKGWTARISSYTFKE